MSAGEPPRIEPWHERLLRNGDHNNERLFMQSEIDDLRAALVSLPSLRDAHRCGAGLHC